jgi:hypothetical protein
MDSLSTALRQVGVATPRPLPGFEKTGILHVPVSGKAAFGIWKALHQTVADTGYWPVLAQAHEPEHLQKLLSVDAAAGSPTSSLTSFRDNALREALVVPFDQWLRRERDPEYKAAQALAEAELFEKHGVIALAQTFREFAKQYRNSPPWSFDPAKCDWPTGDVRIRERGALELLTTWSADMKPLVVESATLLLLPTRNGWEAPAYLLFGSFNACPAASAHVAMLKWVAEKYDGVLVGLGSGMMEIVVGRRPAARDAALRLARDFGTYAEAVQGTMMMDKTVGEIAASLRESDTWSFWWD